MVVVVVFLLIFTPACEVSFLLLSSFFARMVGGVGARLR